MTYAVMILDGMGFRDVARRQLWHQLAAERPKDIRLRVRANKGNTERFCRAPFGRG